MFGSYVNCLDVVLNFCELFCQVIAGSQLLDSIQCLQPLLLLYMLNVLIYMYVTRVKFSIFNLKGLANILISPLIISGKATLTEVNSVKELTDILVLNKAYLVNKSSRARNKFNIVSCDDKLVFNILGAFACNTGKHVYNTDTLLSQEITDLNNLSLIFNVNVNGKMCVDKTHLVFEALGGTCDHVHDVRCACADRSKSLATPEMAVHTKLLLTLLFKEIHVYSQMLKVALKGACKIIILKIKELVQEYALQNYMAD